MNKAIYPGTFDPVTYGHIDVIERALKIFDQVIVACAHNPQKNPLFSVAERIGMLKEATKGLRGVVVDDFDVLVVDYAKSKGVVTVIRGLRAVSDFEYEFQMALTNRKLSDEIETVFMMPSEAFSYLSSKLIKEAASLGGNISAFVPEFVANELAARLRKR